MHKIDVQQGNFVSQEAVARLKPGMSKAEVRQLLGTPLLNDVFHADRWDYYFSSVRGRRADDRTTLTVFFKDDKLVEWKGSGRREGPLSGESAPLMRR